MKTKPYWSKLCPAEFLADRNVERMSLAELGLQCYLLMRSWMDGGIPASLDELRRDAMPRDLSPKELKKLWENVAPCWKSSENRQILINEQQEAERKLVGDYSARQSRAGKASAEKRLKEKEVAATMVEPPLNHSVEPEVNRGLTKYNTDTNTTQHNNNTDGPSDSLRDEPNAFDTEAAFNRLWKAYPAKGRTQFTLAQQYFVEEIRNERPSRLRWNRSLPASSPSRQIGRRASSEPCQHGGFITARGRRKIQKRRSRKSRSILWTPRHGGASNKLARTAIAGRFMGSIRLQGMHSARRRSNSSSLCTQPNTWAISAQRFAL